MTELIWDGKYTDGKRQIPVPVAPIGIPGNGTVKTLEVEAR